MIMSNATVSVPPSHHSRRKALRSQRRWKFWQGVWRFVLLTGFSGGLVWGFSHPHWLIRSVSQISIEGNQWLSDDKIAKMLKVSYPQTLWQFPSQTLKQQLEKQPPLQEVVLSRELFPPHIVVTVEERVPIVEAVSEGKKGFLDQEGVFIPATFYNATDKRLKFPFQVLGYQTKYQAAWQSLYPITQQSPLKIDRLDWRNPNNLILETELGRVYLGAYSDHFPQQLKVLSQMIDLPSRLPKDRVNYIDLSNPTQPTVQLKPLPKNSASSAKNVKNP